MKKFVYRPDMANMQQSIQELAASFANSVLGTLNADAAKIVGTEVLWFRAIPDKRNQEILFQEYTLFGVEDCPLKFNAVYTDTSYDDALILYNMMGTEVQNPLTLQIAVNTWYQVTNFDGTQPQKHDIVFIPLSNKLLQVESMTPIKAVSAQLTGWKVNCRQYQPSMSRHVGENLKKSIEDNTVSQAELFGEMTKEIVDNIMDIPQLGLMDSTSKDPIKEIAAAQVTRTQNDLKVNIVSKDLMVDGHTFARTYYDMNVAFNPVVTYKNIHDTFGEDDYRCYSAWFNTNVFEENKTKNIKAGNIKVESVDDNYAYLKLEGIGSYSVGDRLVIDRGLVVIYGEVTSVKPLTIRTNKRRLMKIYQSDNEWNIKPGYTVRKSSYVNLLSGKASDGNKFSLSVCGGDSVVLLMDGQETVFKLEKALYDGLWYGIIVNIGKTVTIDVYRREAGLERWSHTETPFKKFKGGEYVDYHIEPSYACLTNIRYYNVRNTAVDKQITDMVSYNIANNYNAVINDSADTYIDMKYFGEQR